jgi:hypothetical protein
METQPPCWCVALESHTCKKEEGRHNGWFQLLRHRNSGQHKGLAEAWRERYRLGQFQLSPAGWWRVDASRAGKRNCNNKMLKTQKGTVADAWERASGGTVNIPNAKF